MKRLVRLVGVPVAAICASVLSTFALEPPPVHLSSADFPAWRGSVHMLVVTNYDSDQVEIVLFIEKPPQPDVYWSVGLDLCHGTNRVAQLELGYDVLGPDLLALTGAKVGVVKAVQRFKLSVSSNSLPQSTACFTQRVKFQRPWQVGDLSSPTTVSLSDVFKNATGGFREGQPLFPARQ